MAAGPGAASGPASNVAFKSSLERRFQGVSNTMESVQGLSAWCIENKKHHGLIVRYWMKCLRKSEAAHRLNLFYLANDVIQNCRRKNAIVYRTSFAEVLPAAVLLVRDPKVRKSVERILAIWMERNIYPEEFISELEASLASKAAPPASINSKASLKAKIVAEFVPNAFRQQLSAYKRSLEEVELKEKQLAALGVDICSTEAFKKLKDKAGGKKFSKDFEDSSKKFHDFVGFLEDQVKGGRPLLEALSNADMFYEMQYKEVKIIAKAYMSFASRVSNLKQKLDNLKSTLPSLDDSPVPSPCEDAPSPAGSESPFHSVHSEGMESVGRGAGLGPTLLAAASHGNTQRHGEWDNRDVEDMEVSEGEEAESTSIIVEEQAEQAVPISMGEPDRVRAHVQGAPETADDQQLAKNPVLSLPLNPTNVDLAKINSILSSLTSVMKGTGTSTPPDSRSVLKAQNLGGPPLASLIPQVDTNPQALLNALSKVQGQGGELHGTLSHQQGVTEGMSSVASGCTSESASMLCPVDRGDPRVFSTRGGSSPRHAPSEPIMGNNPGQNLDGLGRQETTSSELSSSASLEDKIHKFLQGNPLFGGLNGSALNASLFLDSSSPHVATENVDGTPLRDEAGGTPTQDEAVVESVVGQGTGSVSDRSPGTLSSWHLPGRRAGGGTPAALPTQPALYQSIEPWVSSSSNREAPPTGSLGGSRQTAGRHVQGAGSSTTAVTVTWVPAEGSISKAHLGKEEVWNGNWPSEGLSSHLDSCLLSPPGSSSSVNLGASSSAQAPLPPGGRPALYPGEAAPHHPPPSNFLSTPLPPIPQLPPPPKEFLTTSPQVGGTPMSGCATSGPPSGTEERKPAGGNDSGLPQPLPPWVGRGVGPNSKPPPAVVPAWSGGPPTCPPPEHIQPHHPRAPQHPSAGYQTQLLPPHHQPPPILHHTPPFNNCEAPRPIPPHFSGGPRRGLPGPPFCPPKRHFLPPYH